MPYQMMFISLNSQKALRRTQSLQVMEGLDGQRPPGSSWLHSHPRTRLPQGGRATARRKSHLHPPAALGSRPKLAPTAWVPPANTPPPPSSDQKALCPHMPMAHPSFDTNLYSNVTFSEATLDHRIYICSPRHSCPDFLILISSEHSTLSKVSCQCVLDSQRPACLPSRTEVAPNTEPVCFVPLSAPLGPKQCWARLCQSTLSAA